MPKIGKTWGGLWTEDLSYSCLLGDRFSMKWTILDNLRRGAGVVRADKMRFVALFAAEQQEEDDGVYGRRGVE